MTRARKKIGTRSVEMAPAFSSELSLLSNDDLWFKVSVESGMANFTRIYVSQGIMNSDKHQNGQGIDLQPQECRALAKMLLAAAELAESTPSMHLLNNEE